MAPITPTDFARVTGYELVDRDHSGDVSAGDRVRVRPNEAAVSMSVADLERMVATYARVRTDPSWQRANAKKTLRSLAKDLNHSVLDASPWIVTHREARHAHDVLMATSPAVFNEVLHGMSAEMLSTYIVDLAAADPWNVNNVERPMLAELAEKMALELEPGRVGRRGIIDKLTPDARQRLLEAVMALPNGALVQRFAQRVGPEQFRRLIEGEHTNTVIGAGLRHGHVWGDNVTQDFKRAYVADHISELPLPSNAKDYVYVLGEGLGGGFAPGYLDVNARALEHWGIPAANIHRFHYNTVDSADTNADRIYEQVEALHDAGKHVIVMGHSKFGADMKAAFNRHPDLQAMVSGAVMVQPADVAQLANDLLHTPAMQSVLRPLLDLIGSNEQAFTCLADPSLADAPWPGKKVPTVIVATSSVSPAAVLAPLALGYYEHFYHTPSDGLVPMVDQACYDDAAVVVLPGAADHDRPCDTVHDILIRLADQIDAGQLDPAFARALARMATRPELAVLRPVAELIERGLKANDRIYVTRELRRLAPVVDAALRVVRAESPYHLLQPAPMTRAAFSVLLHRMAAAPAAPHPAA